MNDKATVTDSQRIYCETEKWVFYHHPFYPFLHQKKSRCNIDTNYLPFGIHHTLQSLPFSAAWMLKISGERDKKYLSACRVVYEEQFLSSDQSLWGPEQWRTTSPPRPHPGFCWTYAVLASTLPAEIQEHVLSLDTVATAASAGNTSDWESGDEGPGAVSSFDERDLWAVMFPPHVSLHFGSKCNLPTSALVLSNTMT